MGWSFARGALETLGIVAAFVAAGAVWAVVVRGAPAGRAPYLPAAMAIADGSEGRDPGPLWLVDGFNVLNVGLLRERSREGWWRSQRRDELLALASGFEEPGAEVWVVFDGPHPPLPGAVRGRVRAVFAPSADAWVLARIRESPDPGRVRLVTADRRLAERARRRGATIVTPAEFLARCRQEREGARSAS